eukprot:FR736434.1.p1 GENE.FR736434.1~~FR736434.1.p1  ORF type:complete len:298 (+),score=-1.47 FR736434.1:36-929(+)
MLLEIPRKAQTQSEPEKKHTDAPSESPIVSLVPFLQVSLLILVLPGPGLRLAYAVTGDSWYEGSAVATLYICLSAALIGWLSAPCRKDYEPWLTAVAVVWLVVWFGGRIAGVYQDPSVDTSVAAPVVMPLLVLAVGLGLIHPFLRVRRQIGSQSPEYLQGYIRDNVFKHGWSSLSAQVYLAAGGVACILSTTDNVDIYKVCGAGLIPANTIGVTLLMFLAFRLVVVPLQASKVALDDTILKGSLTVGAKVQILLTTPLSISEFGLLRHHGSAGRKGDGLHVGTVLGQRSLLRGTRHL